MKLYFEKHGERCMTIESHKQFMAFTNEETREVYLAKPDRNNGYFYCKENEEVGEKGNCGRICGDYAPRNGRSGICKHNGLLYEPTEVKKTIVNPYFEG
jgi:hypothetical protein